MKTYQLSATGRRNVMLLMIGAGLIWVFAIWTFQSTLAISYSPGKILDSLQVHEEYDDDEIGSHILFVLL